MTVLGKSVVDLEDLPVRHDTVGATCVGITVRVKALLAQTNRSPEDLAYVTGIGCVRLQNRLNLQAPWSLSEVEELTRVFGVPWSHWFDE